MKNGWTLYVPAEKEIIFRNNYDIIIGAVANDDVFKTVDMYFRGIWSKKKALDESK